MCKKNAREVTMNNDCNHQFKSRYPPDYDKLICSKCGKEFENR